MSAEETKKSTRASSAMIAGRGTSTIFRTTKGPSSWPKGDPPRPLKISSNRNESVNTARAYGFAATKYAGRWVLIERLDLEWQGRRDEVRLS